MAGERRPPVWGLWNEQVGDWFNPGGRAPYFRTREEAERFIPVARRQYAFGTWEVREYPRDLPEQTDEEESEGEPAA